MPSHSRSSGDQQQVWLWLVFGRHSRAQNRTWKKNNCPMSLPHAGWGARVGVAVGVCVGSLHAIPARQACFAD